MCRVWTCVSYIFLHSRRKTRSHLRLSSSFKFSSSRVCLANNNMVVYFFNAEEMKISHICCWYYWVKSYETPQIRRKSGLMNERLRPKRHWSHSSQQPVFCGKTFERENFKHLPNTIVVSSSSSFSSFSSRSSSIIEFKWILLGQYYWLLTSAFRAFKSDSLHKTTWYKTLARVHLNHPDTSSIYENFKQIFWGWFGRQIDAAW